MVLKKRAAAIESDEPRKKKRDEKQEEVTSTTKKKEYAPKVKVEESSEDEELHDEEEVPSDVENHDDDEEEAAEAPQWPQADLLELISRMESKIPNNDTLSYGTRAQRLDWDEIAFNNYQPEECRSVWMQILKKVRKYRLLKEVLVDARQWAHKPWTNFYNASKQNNHPDMPRRPLSSYMLYYLDMKDKIAAQYPNMDMTQLSQIISRMYKSLSDEKKTKYSEKAAVLREKYHEQMEKFFEKHPQYKENEKRSSDRSRSGLPSGLQKPRTPQMMFIADRLEKLKDEPGFDKVQVANLAKEQWKNLSEKKKLVWINWALEEETKYLDALKLHMSENPNFQPPSYKPVLKKEEHKLKQRLSGKPERPPNSAYSLYSRIMLAKCAKLRELVPKARMQEISRQWHAMSEAEKDEYSKRVKYEQDRYKLEYATYLESLPEDERQEELLKTQTQPKKKKAVVNNGKKASQTKPPKTNRKVEAAKKVERLYFPGEPHQPPVNAYELFVESFVSDTKLSPTEAPRFWDMLPQTDKSKFQRKLKELKEKYIRDYKKFLRSLDEEQVAKYNDLQKRNKEREAAAQQSEESEEENSDENEASSDDENEEANNVVNKNNEAGGDSDSDE